MRTKTTTQPVTRKIACLLSVCSCLTSISALAATKDPSASPLLRQGMQLKMDVAMLNPALMVAAEDDCEGDLTMQSAIIAPVQLASLGPINASAPVAALTPPAARPNAEAKLPPVVAQAAAPAPAPAPAQAQAPKAGQTWEIVPADRTLNGALARWAATAGWQLVWELPVDYSVDARTTVAGTFEDAVGVVARSMESAEIPLKAIFYAGNKVLRIVAKGVE